MTKVCILGIDGYLGWTLAMYLSRRGYDVCGVDNLSRRKFVKDGGSDSAIPILPIDSRLSTWHEYSGQIVSASYIDITDTKNIADYLKEEQPDSIVHLGEIPSAPFSMIDVDHANFTQINNIIGTNNILWAMKEHLPDAHLVKLGTMGEYGTPNIDIPEGTFEVEYRGRKDTLPFPRQPGSFYHLSKVHDTYNIMFACKMWGLRSTDIMQGVVHGVKADDDIPDCLLTRFDFDGIWGTAINRFCAQAVIGEEITPYGKGGQTRGYLTIRDSMQCLRLAIDNPPKEGEYRTFNQFEKTYEINKLANIVAGVADEFDIIAKVNHIANPRIEKEDHYYNPDHNHLPSLGFVPSHSIKHELRITIPILMKYARRIERYKKAIYPKVKWGK